MRETFDGQVNSGDPSSLLLTAWLAVDFAHHHVQ